MIETLAAPSSTRCLPTVVRGTQSRVTWAVGDRVVTALLVMIAVTVALVATLHLLDGRPVGAGDNSDGGRLFCAAGLAPDATGGHSNWRGVVVTEFETGGTPCPDGAATTSGGTVLRAAVALAPLLQDGGAPGEPLRFSLRWLGGVYAVLIGLGAGLAALACTARSPVRGVLLVAPLLPLVAVPWWSRFFVSTYDEAAGLLGTVWVALGLVVVSVTRPADRGPRWIALGLLAVGGLVAATAKPAFLPVGILAVLTCGLVAVGVRAGAVRRRVPGAVLALAVALTAAAPVASAVAAQHRFYLLNNVHDLVFAGVLIESGPGATTALGLAPDAVDHAGEGYYFDLGAGVPAYSTTVADRPEELRSAALAYLATHPRVAAAMISRGLKATALPELSYLPSVGGGPGTVTGGPTDFHPDDWLLMGALFEDLDALPAPWLPAGLVGVALLAGVATLLVGRARRPRTDSGAVLVGLVRSTAALAAAGVGIVTLAVLGDGYYELTKHVWPASYLLVVMSGTGLVTIAATVLEAVRARRSSAGRFDQDARDASPGTVMRMTSCSSSAV